MRPFSPHLDGYQDVSDQLAAHLRRRAAEAFAAEDREKEALATPAAFQARRARLRQHMLTAIGGLPDLPPHIAATVTGRIAPTSETDGRSEPSPAGADGRPTSPAPFAIEKLLLETLPGVLATANLYLPQAATAPSPAVLFLCGHAREAKAYPNYQKVCRALARAGFIVLALDPVGQGERLQYLDPQSGQERIGWGTTEHSHAGFQTTLIGHGIARYFLADAMAAITYLAARPDVDPTRIGVTGNSGGGTQAAYLIFLDERLAAGAPCTFITDRANYVATGQAHDSEQNIWGAIAQGLNYDDLASGLAPKPLMLGAVASDFFTIEGTLRAHTRLQHVYDLYGRPQDLYLTVAPGTHEFSPVLRDAVVRFFRRHLRGEAVDLAPGLTSLAPPIEGPLPVAARPSPPAEDTLPPEDLQVTASGQVALDHPAARTVFDLHVEAFGRRVPEPDPQVRCARLARAILARRPRPPMWVREVAGGTQDGVAWGHRYTFSEPDIAVPMLVVAPEGTAPDAPLTVAALPEGTNTAPDRLKALATQHGRLLLFDPRGTGAAAQRPVNPRPPDHLYGTLYKLNADALMLGDTLLAMRAFDALRVLEYAHRIAAEVAVLGEDNAGIPLLLAATLDGEVQRATFIGLPASFADLALQRYPSPDWTMEARGLATDWPDVPELVQALTTPAL